MQKPKGFEIIEDRFIITIQVVRSKRKSDIDNLAKAILDACQKNGIIKNDSLADEVVIRSTTIENVPEGCKIIIEPY